MLNSFTGESRMTLRILILAFTALHGYTTMVHASQEQSPCTPIKNFGWDLYTTLVNPTLPFFSSPDAKNIVIAPSSQQSYALTPITAKTNHSIPAAQQVLTKGISLTYANNAHCFQPQGQALFGNSSIAGSFNSMVEAIRSTGSYATKTKGSNSKFVPIFRKLQYQILNNLYSYLTALYTNFILTIAPVDTQNPSSFDLYRSYAKLDETEDLTNKSLIVCHLINLIQGQMFSICSSTNPVLPTSLTVRTGSILLENDQTIDPLFLLINVKRPFFDGDDTNSDVHRLLYNIQQRYMQTLGNVLNFFRSYTDVVRTNPNQFLTFARSIRDTLNKNPFNLQAQSLKKRYSTNVTTKHQELKKLRATANPINPPLLYFDAEMIRSLQVLPTLATALKSSAPVGWPDQIEKLALRQTRAKDGSGNNLAFNVATIQDNRLFIQIASPRGVPYMQELIKEPAWLNSKDGIISMIQACLGDFSQLIGRGILEPELEYMIATSLNMNINPQVRNGTQRTLNAIYTAQADYAKDQCTMQTTCCKAAQNDTQYQNTCSYLKQTCGKKQS